MTTPTLTFNDGIEAAAYALHRWADSYQVKLNDKQKLSDARPMSLGLANEVSQLRTNVQLLRDAAHTVRKLRQ